METVVSACGLLIYQAHYQGAYFVDRCGAVQALPALHFEELNMTVVIEQTEQNDQPVTAVISHLVKPERRDDYERWLHGIASAAQQFEGHMGVSIIRPDDPTYPEYVSILRFDHYINLRQWLESEVRKNWLNWAKPLIQKDETVQTLTGLEAWFTLPDRPLKRPPKRYKMAILTTLAVYTLSNLLGHVLTPLLSGIPAWLRSLLIIALVVVLLTYVVMPQLTRLFYPWLYPAKRSPQSTDAAVY